MAPPVPPKKQFCKHGHDTHVCGRAKGSYSCIACANARTRKLYHEKGGRDKARIQNRIYEPFKKYGLTPADIQSMLNRQQRKCLGCLGELKEGTKRGERFHIDHDHTTGRVRGLLCPHCNTVLGLVKEHKTTLRRLMTYLDYDRAKRYVYIIGALKNTRIPEVAGQLRLAGLEAIDEWYSAGPEADSYWQAYELQRGRSFAEALKSRSAQNVFNFDKALIDQADCGVLVMPAGRSGHLEAGYMAGSGKPTYILQEEGDPERYDVMPQFASGLFTSVNELATQIKRDLVW